MTVHLPSRKPLSVTQRERTRSLIFAISVTALTAAAVLVFGGAQAAEVCKPPADKTSEFMGDGKTRKPFKIVSARNMPSVYGGQYLEFDILDWRSGAKCAWSEKSRTVSEFYVGQATAKKYVSTGQPEGQPKQ